MLRKLVILVLSVAAAWPVPQASSKAELKRLARLPKVEFAPPLQFDRRSGFVVFPDVATATAAAAKILANAKGVPSEAPKFLEVARLLEANGDFGSGLKFYARAADLFRKRVEAEAGSASDLAGLAEALVSIGRSAEALTHLDKALSISPESGEVLAAAARVYQERAWQAATGDQRLFTNASFLDTATELLKDPPEPARIAEAQRFFALASAANEKLSAREDSDGRFEFQYSTFLSFRAAMNELFRQAQGSESKILEIRKQLFNDPALEALREGAEKARGSPTVLATAAFATVFGHAYASSRSENLLAQPVWPSLNRGLQDQLRDYCSRLESMAESGSEAASSAAEFLGCVQLYVLRDFEGGQRSFRQAVQREARRHRSWDLLVLATFMSADAGELVDTCQSRFNSMPDARSSLFLAKAYDRNSDAARAEMICVATLAAHPNDLLLNLSLAALLLKRDNAENFLFRVQDLMRKAEKQVTAASSTQSILDFALTKSIFLGLSDKPEEARAALRLFSSGPVVPLEVQEVLRVLDR